MLLSVSRPDGTSLLKGLTYSQRAGTFDLIPHVFQGLSRSEVSWRISDHYPLWCAFRLRRACHLPGGRPSIVSRVTISISPAQAWQRLLDGNARFVSGDAKHPNQGASRRSELVNDQNPFAVIFGCSDSRLAAEIIFDLGLGDAFVVRTAGHVLDDSVLGSLEYSVSILHVPLIVVLGHDNCGAVTAAKEALETGEMPPRFIRDLVERITPSVLTSQREGRTQVNEMVVDHARLTAERLLESSPVIAAAVHDSSTAVVGVAYHLAEGRAQLVTDSPLL